MIESKRERGPYEKLADAVSDMLYTGGGSSESAREAYDNVESAYESVQEIDGIHPARADAAPDLLAACEAALEHVESSLSQVTADSDETPDLLRQLSAAITKARGES